MAQLCLSADERYGWDPQRGYILDVEVTIWGEMDDENDVSVDMGMIENDDKGGRESESEESAHNNNYMFIYENMTSGAYYVQ